MKNKIIMVTYGLVCAFFGFSSAFFNIAVFIILAVLLGFLGYILSDSLDYNLPDSISYDEGFVKDDFDRIDRNEFVEIDNDGNPRL